MSRKRSGQFMVPGERLGVIEEYMPGPGTYTEEGVIHSKIVGRALMDILNKKVSVYPLAHVVNIPRTGSIVVGQISRVDRKTATLRISKIEKKTLTGFFTGVLHISDVSPGYVETMSDACKTGDFMRAKVISEKNRTYHLSTVDSNLGVICAFCSTCGYILSLRRREMQCTRCGRFERRKVALDYGKGAM